MKPDMEVAESISVVVPTIDGADRIGRTIDSILANDYPRFDLTIVDESGNDYCTRAVDPYRRDPRFQYIHLRARGVSIGRNRGTLHTQGEWIAYTDDDCTVPVDWLSRLRAVFRRDARIGLVTGNVVPAAPPTADGFIAGYQRADTVLARSISDRHRIEALAANIAVRRSVWQAVHGFDEMLGAGAPLRSAAENDLLTRVLLAGYWACATPELSVTHHGLRTWERSSQVVYDYMFGTGAMFAKHLWRAPLATANQLGRMALRWVRGGAAIDLGWNPPRSLRLRAFLRGILAGAAVPVEKGTGHFVRR